MISHEDPFIRSWAARALGSYGHDESIEMIVPLLADLGLVPGGRWDPLSSPVASIAIQALGDLVVLNPRLKYGPALPYVQAMVESGYCPAMPIV